MWMKREQTTLYKRGTMGADAAYLGMEDGKVKFMLSGVIGAGRSHGSDPIVSLDEAQSISHYEVIDGQTDPPGWTVDMSKTF